MKTVFVSVLLMITLPSKSVYDFKMTSIDGTLIDFADYKGKTLLIVNVASKCGFTKQYKELQQLHESYGEKVTILAFPANDFGNQEPGSNLQIAEFCQQNFGVTFQMFEKITVTGPEQHPLYQLLKEKTGEQPSWNFCKYLVKPDGTVKFFPSKVNPMGKEIVDAII